MIQFIPYKGVEMNSYEKNLILTIFGQLSDVNSFYSNLQYIYNNYNHTLHNRSICSYFDINSLLDLAHDPVKNLQIEGSIHYNYHISNILLSTVDYAPLFVKDTYIRMRYPNNKVYHLFVSEPTTQEPAIIKLNPICPIPVYLIFPVVNAEFS